MKIAGKSGQFLLQRGVFGSGGVESRSSGVWLAAGAACGRFWLYGFFLFVL